MRTFLVAVACAAATACAESLAPAPFLKDAAKDLEFTASMARNRLQVGDTITIVFRLHNPTSERVTLQFNSTCQVGPLVKRGTEQVFGPPFLCGAALTSIVLEPGATHLRPFWFRAKPEGNEPQVLPGPAFPPGSYTAYGELMNGDGRSTSVEFIIVPN